MSEWQDMMKLQELNIAQEISLELQQRGIIEESIPQQIIVKCKQASSQEQFIDSIKNNVINISEQFLSNLYHTIKQKLPLIQHVLFSNPIINEQNRIPQDFSTDQNKRTNGHDDPNNYNINQDKDYKVDFEFSAQNKIKKSGNLNQPIQGSLQSRFPGLCLPDKDEIELGLKEEDLKAEESVKRSEGLQQYHRTRKSSDSNSPSKSKYRYSKHEINRDKYKGQSRNQGIHKGDNRYKESRDRQDQQKNYKYREGHRYRNQLREEERHWPGKHGRVHDEIERSGRWRSRSRERRGRQKIQAVEGQVYRGRVIKVNKIGCVVKIFDMETSKPCILHPSEIKNDANVDPTSVLREGQKVFVKIVGILEDRIRLSMKNINQRTGRDLAKQIPESEHKNEETDEFGNLTGIKIQHTEGAGPGGDINKFTELWEMQQMSYMGGIKKVRPPPEEEIEEVEIQMNDREPPFLRGQTTKTGINLSPVRIIKNPQGTLHRQALNAVQYAKERRQIREQQSKGELRDTSKILEENTPAKPIPRSNVPRSSRTIQQQRRSLPIYEYRTKLIEACRNNKILIVIGETGSGKTTQMTQYLHEAGFTKTGKIGCTQPRRVAAISVAKRVCEEMEVKLGQEVGFSIRFEDCTSRRTLIKYMTDGMLLRQALIDKYLSQYSVIMLDQAHERTIHTDVLFGILKQVIQKRNDLLLIVTSATLEAQKFSTYFFDCKIFSIPGRTYEVELLYAKEPETDYLDASLMCVLQIHIDEPPGDILLFLTGQEEIDTACQVLKERLRKLGDDIPELIILPVYSALPSEVQTKIFQPSPKGKRKCVIATNIAEASLTIDGIFYVVDPGFSKVKIFNSKVGMDTLVVAPISQASAKQRAGRAGRTGPGKCYRLYTEEAYQKEMLPTSVPEIQRANLSNTVLELKAMGINDLIRFDFMDPPPVQTLIAALQQLYYLSALDDEGLLTKIGLKMAQFPLDPPLSKMLLTSIDFGCVQEIIIIISMLSVQSIFYRPKEKEALADQKKIKFNHPDGDHLTMLAVYRAWVKNNRSSSWCTENFLHQRSLTRAYDVIKQLTDLMQRYNFPIKSACNNYALIRKTIVAGFFFHAVKKDSKGGYRTLVDDHQVYIHPSSALFNKEPQWAIYHELVYTSKEYMRDVCSINRKWLIDVAPNFFKFTDQVGYTRKKRNQKLEPLKQKYGDPDAWRISKRKG